MSINVNRVPDLLVQSINLRLAMIDRPLADGGEGEPSNNFLGPFVARYQEAVRKVPQQLCPADFRVQVWLDGYLKGGENLPELPTKTFILDQAGLARALSLPVRGDRFSSELVTSYRLAQGVLHNPANDRRTTEGVFHIAEGGLPVPDDKKIVPKATFARLLSHAFTPPRETLRLPYTQGQENEAECFVSLLLRPLVCPGVPGFIEEKSLEVRFFAPGSLVSNLDFVEAIFGNGGDPYLTDNDAALDVEHWTGHTGCVILAPHLTKLRKRELGLPSWEEATPRQRRDGMCWKEESELYNGGAAFKVTARDERGVMITVIADNYYGYCKKEIKSLINFSANLFGLAEEEHAGGALVYPSYALEDKFDAYSSPQRYSFDSVIAQWGDEWQLKDEGFAVHRDYPEIILVPEQGLFDLRSQTVSWSGPDGLKREIKLFANCRYVRPSGYRVHMEPIAEKGSAWRLVGTVAEGTLCHKPSTVSGGGKSEISKAIDYAILAGHVFVADYAKDFDQVESILAKDTSQRFRDSTRNDKDHRNILSAERSLGSVIKLLTPSPREYTDDYNAWLNSIPQHVHALVLVLKQHYKPEWSTDWRHHFSVDTIDGRPGYELKLEGRKLVTNCLRVGFQEDGSWRVFSLRGDFHPAAKVQMEDDITASIVVPRVAVEKQALPERGIEAAVEGLAAPPRGISWKLVRNCEARLFQRPDDAIHPGYDLQAEADIASSGTFLSNYEPLTAEGARTLMQDGIGFRAFSAPMRDLITRAAGGASGDPKYFVCSAQPRLVNGKPTKNPRYLQIRPDVAHPLETRLAEITARLHRHLGPSEPLLTPVNVLVPGRRNNPPEKGIRALAVFSPLHFLELPELFMEFISSMTGKSPSTTGAGSEGALTKGPFNALPPIYDLNAALLSLILTGHDAFLSAAGYAGPKVRVDHDVSLLVPEVFSRMTAVERDARALIADGCLERCEDFVYEGKQVLASRLGYRITARFVRVYFGRIFNHPDTVFTEEMLRPELQDKATFAEGMDNIAVTHHRVAASYFADDSVALACPPLRALLHVMAYGSYEEKSLLDPEIRKLFTRESVLNSPWYDERLVAKQRNDAALWRMHCRNLTSYLESPDERKSGNQLDLQKRFALVHERLSRIESPEYLESLRGTLGVQAELG